MEPFTMTFAAMACRLAYTTKVYSTHTANPVLTPSDVPGYKVGMRLIVLVAQGIYLYSTYNLNAGFALIGFNAADQITLVNRGVIIGRGGDGGQSASSNGNFGGPGIILSCPTIIDNQLGFIGGGGGGGASYTAGGGGGAGGGLGGFGVSGTQGSGGGIGSPGASGTGNCGGGGGKVLPSSAYVGGGQVFVANASAPGAGGYGGGSGGARTNSSFAYAGGGGGDWGQPGSAAANGNCNVAQGGTGGGNGQPATGGYTSPDFNPVLSGGAGGKAVQLNGNALTWLGGTNSSSRAYGAVS